MRELYGDGLRDDTDAIQQRLDSGSPLVYLPPPAEAYTISRPLRIHSRQTLRLDRFSVIRLAPDSNCVMLRNADQETGNTDITVCGGIWDMHNLAQAKNPVHFPYPPVEPDKGMTYTENYFGTALRFFHVTNLTLRELTVKDPVTFAIQMARIRQATVEDIRFDFNDGNPWPVNMDGVHLDGDCRFIRIANVKGSCYDDMVALNADDGYCGPIEDVQIDGLFTEDCHSAVRLLSTGSPVRRVTISNVFGSFYQYAVGFSKYFDESGEARGTGERRGLFEYITLTGLYLSKAPRHSRYRKDGTFVYPLIWVENRATVRHLHIRDLYRAEKTTAIPCIGIDPYGEGEDWVLDGIVQENYTGDPIPLLHNQGQLTGLSIGRAEAGEDTCLLNEGILTRKETTPYAGSETV